MVNSGTNGKHAQRAGREQQVEPAALTDTWLLNPGAARFRNAATALLVSRFPALAERSGLHWNFVLGRESGNEDQDYRA